MRIRFRSYKRFSEKLYLSSFQYLYTESGFAGNNLSHIFGDPPNKSKFLNKLNLKYDN